MFTRRRKRNILILSDGGETERSPSKSVSLEHRESCHSTRVGTEGILASVLQLAARSDRLSTSESNHTFGTQIERWR
jgi:hypothetical protein